MRTSRLICLFLAGLLMLSVGSALAAGTAMACQAAHPDRNCYFGDTHAHSMWSTDAFGFGNRLGPENAYQFARGVEAYHVAKGGQKIKLKVPLDFFMMTDQTRLMLPPSFRQGEFEVSGFDSLIPVQDTVESGIELLDAN